MAFPSGNSVIQVVIEIVFYSVCYNIMSFKFKQRLIKKADYSRIVQNISHIFFGISSIIFISSKVVLNNVFRARVKSAFYNGSK